MHFTLRELQVFQSVVSTKSPTVTAAALGTTQPNVSKTLKSFSEKVGVKLFERVHGRLRPTPEAEQLSIQVQFVLDESNELSKFASNMQLEGGGQLAICALPLFASSVLPDAIERFKMAFPKTNLRVQITHQDNIKKSIERGHYEIGLLHFPQGAQGFGSEVEVISTQPLSFLVHKTHRLADHSVLTTQDLVGENLIAYPEFLPFRMEMDAALGNELQEQSNLIVVNYSSLAVELAERKMGIAYGLPASLPVPTKDLKLIPHAKSPLFDIGLLTAGARPLSRAANAFRMLLMDAVNTGSGAFLSITR